MPHKKPSPYQYVRDRYGVPARRGARIRFEGRPGTVVAPRGAYVGIRLDGEKRIGNYHPTWHLDWLIFYLNEGLAL